MARSEFRLLKNVAVLWPKQNRSLIPDKTRGIYFLHMQDKKKNMNVVYVGKAELGGIKGRLNEHEREKGLHWTHFSAYEVHDNIFDQEIAEMEALFLTAYAKDAHANRLNRLSGSRKLTAMRKKTMSTWK